MNMLNAMKEATNFTYTENGALSHATTLDAVQDMFALGGAYRSRPDDDCILLFKSAFEEDNALAMKCLFYLRDILEGQGERRYFRVVSRWLATEHPEVMRRNLQHIPEFGRYDDLLYITYKTGLWENAMEIVRAQLIEDMDIVSRDKNGTGGISLLAKWLPSENASSATTKKLAAAVRSSLHMTPRHYRQMLSALRERIKVLERLMSEGRWEEIEFDKIPSKAGLKYRNAFARRDILKERYKAFAENKDTKVNVAALYPADIVEQAIRASFLDNDNPTRLMTNKYWDNLTDFFNNATFDGVAVVDTSASMRGTPIDVAIALGMYCAEKCAKDSPFYGHYISFSRNARLVPVKGVDFVDKVKRIYDANLCENTNIENVFDLILSTAIVNHMKQEDLMKNVIVISDQEYDAATEYSHTSAETVMEKWERKFKEAGYEIPNLVFWNVSARHDLIPMKDNGCVTYVSGYSPSIMESLLTGKTGRDLMLEKLNSDRYKDIY